MTTPYTHTEVYLKPGEFYFGEGKVRVSTLLGSCVSITLWHPLRRHGGMCHFMLDARTPGQNILDGRYAVEAMELFMAELQRRGTRAAEYEVKVFGGGNMFARTGAPKDDCQDVGCRNIEAARRLLNDCGFRIAAQHVGGAGHRKIHFDLWNGDVWLRFQGAENAGEGKT